MRPADSQDPFSMRTRLVRSFTSFEDDSVHLLQRDLSGATHLVATRKGLYAVNEQEWSQVAHGFFFGITLRADDIFVFEACDQPHSPLPRGRIVRLHREGDRITTADVLIKGLDCGCHQIDFVNGELHVVDTYNQVILRVPENKSSWETLTPLPLPEHRRLEFDPAYVHVNSLLQVGDTILLLLHNKASYTGRRSEVAVFDRDWQPLARWVLQGEDCHGLATLEDGTLLICDSRSGSLISAQGLRKMVCAGNATGAPGMTRGLAVGEDSIAIGISAFTTRDQRLSSTGAIHFLDRDYRLRSVLEMPGAPTEVRRLDGRDSGLSGYLASVPWGSALQEGVRSVY